MDLRKYSTKKLKALYREYNELIREIECYGVNDLRFFYAVIEELKNRE